MTGHHSFLPWPATPEGIYRGGTPTKEVSA